MTPRIVRLVLFVVVLGLPRAVVAQRGGGGRSGGGRDGEAARGISTPDLPSGREIDKLDPVALLISSQRDLELTPEALATLSGVDADLMRATKASLATVDSVRATLKDASESPDARGAVRASMSIYYKAVSDIRAQHDTASTRAIALLTGDPRRKAEKLIRMRREEFDKVTKK